jgi:hypothetical protein
MNDKMVSTIKKTAKRLKDENAKTVVAARKALGKLATAHPEEFVAAGLDASQFPRFRNDVRKYGCLGNVISVDAANEPEAEMRAGHEYYNMLATACIPLVFAYRKAMSGPKQKEGLRLTTRIDAFYTKIGEILQRANFERIKKINPDAVAEAEPKITAMRQEIDSLKAERSKLMTDIFAEMRNLRKKNATKLAKIDKQIEATITKARHNRPVDLWFGNYLRTEEEFKQAVDDVKNAAFYSEATMHFRYERKDGTAPASLMTLPTWNGEGTLTTTLSNIGSAKTRHGLKQVATVMNGTNTRFKLRPLQKEELAKFGLPDGFLNASGSERLYVASIRNCAPTPAETREGKGWYEVVTVLNRPLAEDMTDEVLEASIIRKKIGLQHKTDLHVTMERHTSKMPMGIGTLVITPTFEKLPNGDLKICEWTLNGESGSETLPAAIKSGLDQAKTLNGYIKEHVSYAMNHIQSLGENVLPCGLNAESRGAMHHAYHSWCFMLCPNGSTEQQVGQFKSNLRELRAFARLRHGQFKIAGGTSGGNYGDSYPVTIALMTEKVMVMFNLKKTQASAFAALVAFDERYVHLFQWAANLPRKVLRRRKDIYRNIASRLGRRAAAISVPDVDYRTRQMTEEQAIASPSELVNVLKNFADREGLRFEKRKETDETKPAKKAKAARAGK